ncbi:hypothetical protein [Williamsia soli]|uniref:hypothetical protein n=1 Tax=Williamsia soli TaxID=364929 RepID=UPI001A9DEA4D|nr:hypothetical protein [Williamsia soli]
MVNDNQVVLASQDRSQEVVRAYRAVSSLASKNSLYVEGRSPVLVVRGEVLVSETTVVPNLFVLVGCPG